VKLTPEAAQAFTNLRGNRDFEHVLKWFKEYEAKETQTCITTEGPQLHRAQGSVQALQEIAKANAEAPTTLTKIINSNQR
jgi:hypothetical protein